MNIYVPSLPIPTFFGMRIVICFFQRKKCDIGDYTENVSQWHTHITPRYVLAFYSLLLPSEEAVASSSKSQSVYLGGESVAIEETMFRSVALQAHALLRLLLRLFITLIIFIAVFMIFRLARLLGFRSHHLIQAPDRFGIWQFALNL